MPRADVIGGLGSLLLCRVVAPSYDFMACYRAFRLFTYAQQVFRPDLFNAMTTAATAQGVKGRALAGALTRVCPVTTSPPLTTYTLPTAWERGSMRIVPPRDRLALGTVTWFCNDCGENASISTRSPAEAASLAAEWHAHTCAALPEHWMTAPAEMPCDLCKAHTRARSPRGRPCHPVCAERRTGRRTTTTAEPARGSSRAGPHTRPPSLRTW
ncbi:hypothetical protein ACFZBU_47345 [Embleya sp. NPDC008237]|uniref:hypothetical protein n=1 Tax=Embleya sp. NPDC008237 TaxID=3363978 RepID=UPI0036E28E28